MNVYYPTDEVPATPEYVLELFRENVREWDQPSDLLSFETTVSEFANEWNDTILFWWELARPLNEFTGLNLPLNEWKSILSPMRQRTLREVCEFVASRMRTRQTIRPWHHIGGDCLPAGAFLTARSILARCGADAREITPSTPLEPYFHKCGFEWVGELWRLAPGHLPPLAVDRWFPTCGCLIGLAVSGGLILLGSCLGKAGELFQVFGVHFLLITITISLVVHWLSRNRVALGDLHTFRDLAYALAGQQPRRRIQPTP
jgi:hypothetical protein